MSVDKPRGPPPRRGQVLSTDGTPARHAVEIQLNDNITVEQRKRPPKTVIPRKTDRKINEIEINTPKNERNNEKTKRKPEIMTSGHAIKDSAPEALLTHKPEVQIQQNDLANIPQQGKEKEACDKTDNGKFNTAQSKYTQSFRGRMRPDPSIQHHPAYQVLFEYATEGCPVDCSKSWSKEHLEWR